MYIYIIFLEKVNPGLATFFYFFAVNFFLISDKPFFFVNYIKQYTNCILVFFFLSF